MMHHRFAPLRPLLTLGLLAGLLGGLLLSGCASLSTPKTPEEQVQERAKLYWQHLRVSEWNKAYAYTTPAYRGLVTLEDYRRHAMGDLNWQDVEVTAAECDDSGERCEVVMRLHFSPSTVRGMTLDTYRRDIWLLEDKRWYLHPRN